ncbi:MAG: hypothetical protein ACK5O2_03330 [Microthrixaceae bacterium]
MSAAVNDDAERNTSATTGSGGDPEPRRYRCSACGNLTRFDVTSTVRSRSFHHYSVGGELHIEDTEVLGEQVEEVTCRWCESSASVVELEADDPAGRG